MRMRKQHKGYGKISVGKFQSTRSTFFGSSISHTGGIDITISTCVKETDGSHEYYFTDKVICSVELSYNQWVDLITSSMNTDGVPCTLTFANGEKIPRENYIQDTKDIFRIEMQNTNQKLIEMVNDLSEFVGDGSTGKKKIGEIQHKLKILRSHIEGNIPFVAKCFEEKMVKVITEAKQSFSGFVENKINSLGLSAFRKEIEQISIEEKND